LCKKRISHINFWQKCIYPLKRQPIQIKNKKSPHKQRKLLDTYYTCVVPLNHYNSIVGLPYLISDYTRGEYSDEVSKII
jgi:hypothetical protein